MANKDKQELPRLLAASAHHLSEENLEESLSAVRRSRAVEAVVSLQQRSVEKGTDKISLEEINAEIKSVREKRV